MIETTYYRGVSTYSPRIRIPGTETAAMHAICAENEWLGDQELKEKIVAELSGRFGTNKSKAQNWAINGFRLNGTVRGILPNGLPNVADNRTENKRLASLSPEEVEELIVKPQRQT